MERDDVSAAARDALLQGTLQYAAFACCDQGVKVV